MRVACTIGCQLMGRTSRHRVCTYKGSVRSRVLTHPRSLSEQTEFLSAEFRLVAWFAVAVVLGFELLPREVGNVCILGIIEFLKKVSPSKSALDVSQNPNSGTKFPSLKGVRANKQTN